MAETTYEQVGIFFRKIEEEGLKFCITYAGDADGRAWKVSLYSISFDEKFRCEATMPILMENPEQIDEVLQKIEAEFTPFIGGKVKYNTDKRKWEVIFCAVDEGARDKFLKKLADILLSVWYPDLQKNLCREHGFGGRLVI